jgi:hypothetical protein
VLAARIPAQLTASTGQPKPPPPAPGAQLQRRCCGREPAGRESHAYRLVRTVGVVFLAPAIQRGLQRLDARKRPMHIEQLTLQSLMQPLNLARRSRGMDLGEAVSDAVLPADPVKQHLHRHTGLVEPAGEHLPLNVGQHLLGHPVDAHRICERQAHRTGSSPHDRLGEHAEPGMIIDPGHDLHLGAVDEKRAGGHIQLPQLHRSAAFPAAVILAPAAP